ncbi:conserved domain protein [Chlamydia pneumoniae LPCoLN]|uniref:IncA family protein n=1 Tax=Chlamydia pneumoniae TaxID=83558 RepID=UPI0001BD9E06|nr:IncA family protein [Chlamydia pneumoniae]ACZ33562.1 conserved domain protein [Chlamydia pneumoniae LPCoLN]ETR80491.1 Myosin heavy chain [Chlamydia pneumoniae B21]
MATPAQKSPTFQDPSFVRELGSNHPVFSPLTLEERGEMAIAPVQQCGWNHTIVKVSLFILALLTILGGGLLVGLLPAVPMFIGTGLIALGAVIFALALILCLCDSQGLPEELPPVPEPQQIQIEYLRNETREVLEGTLLEVLLKDRDAKDPAVPQVVVDCEKRLGMLDRKLRREEEILYRSTAHLKDEARYEFLLELLEMRSLVADRLEFNRRSYERFVQGIMTVRSEEGEKEISRLQDLIGLQQQTVQDLRSQIDDEQKRCWTSLQRIHQSQKDIQRAHDREASQRACEGTEMDCAERHQLEKDLRRQLKSMREWIEMRGTIHQQEKAWRKQNAKLERLQEDLRLTKIAFDEQPLFYREYKEKYLSQKLDMQKILQEVNAEKSEKARLKSLVRDYEKQLEQQDANLKKAKAIWEEELGKQQLKDHEQTQEIKRLNTFMLEYQDGLREAEQVAEQVRQDLRQLEEKYSHLQEEKQEKEKILEQSVNHFAERFEALQKENVVYKKKLADLEGAAAPTEIREEDGWILAGSASLSQKKIRELNEENQELLKLLAFKTRELTQLAADVGEAEKEISKLREQIEEQKEELRVLDTMHSEAVKDCEAAQRKCRDLEGLLSPVREDAGMRFELEIELQRLREENAQLRLEVERLEQEQLQG